MEGGDSLEPVDWSVLEAFACVYEGGGYGPGKRVASRLSCHVQSDDALGVWEYEERAG